MKHYFIYYAAYNGDVLLGEGNATFTHTEFDMYGIHKMLMNDWSASTKIVIKFVAVV
jgi:hypothetical protein